MKSRKLANERAEAAEAAKLAAHILDVASFRDAQLAEHQRKMEAIKELSLTTLARFEKETEERARKYKEDEAVMNNDLERIAKKLAETAVAEPPAAESPGNQDAQPEALMDDQTMQHTMAMGRQKQEELIRLLQLSWKQQEGDEDVEDADMKVADQDVEEAAEEAAEEIRKEAEAERKQADEAKRDRQGNAETSLEKKPKR
jgi:hypothetical protein